MNINLLPEVAKQAYVRKSSDEDATKNVTKSGVPTVARDKIVSVDINVVSRFAHTIEAQVMMTEDLPADAVMTVQGTMQEIRHFVAYMRAMHTVQDELNFKLHETTERVEKLEHELRLRNIRKRPGQEHTLDTSMGKSDD